MAEATIGITLKGNRVDLSGEIPDEMATDILQSITAVLIDASRATPTTTN